MRARVNLPRNPRVDLAVLVKQAFRSDKTRGVEYMPRILWIGFEEAAGLDKSVSFLGLAEVAVRVLIRNRNRELVQKFLWCQIDRSRMGKLRENDESHVAEWLVPDDRRINHRQHPVHAGRDLGPVLRVREVRRTRGRQVAKGRHGGTTVGGRIRSPLANA